MYVTGEVKHNIDELVDDLKHAVKLDISQDECPNIIQILDSMVNVSKTSIEGTMRKLQLYIELYYNRFECVTNILYFLFFPNLSSICNLCNLILYYVKLLLISIWF